MALFTVQVAVTVICTEKIEVVVAARTTLSDASRTTTASTTERLRSFEPNCITFLVERIA